MNSDFSRGKLAQTWASVAAIQGPSTQSLPTKPAGVLSKNRFGALLKSLLVSGCVLFAWVGPAAAVPVTMTFTVSNFEPSNGNNAPTVPISGKIVWEAASATSSIDALISIDLTLDGHTYTIGELGFISPLVGLGDMIGGSIGDANGTSDLTDDFGILFDLASGTPGAHGTFSYASSQRSGIWDSKTFDQFSITVAGATPGPAEIPEPGSLALVAAALMGVTGVRRRSK